MGESSTEHGVAPVRFSRLETRGVILGLTGGQTVALGVALVVFIAGLYAGGSTVWHLSLVWGSAVTVAAGRVSGKPAVDWLPIAVAWRIRLATGRTSHRRRAMAPRRTGTLELPGSKQPLGLWVDPQTGAVMVHDRQHRRLIAIAEVQHRSFLLLEPSEQQRRVEGWGHVLAAACQSGHIARLQVMERTIPDPGTGLASWWAQHGTHDGSWVADTYADLISRAGPAGERHTTTISIALDLTEANRAIRAAGGGTAGAADVLRREMAALRQGLIAADLGPVRWIDRNTLGGHIRAAYDPAATDQPTPPEQAGPMAIEEGWDRIRVDNGWHTVLWISDWPRSHVHPGFLAPLLLSSGLRRTFTLTCDPIRPDLAARDLRRRKTEHLADAAQRERIGRIEDARMSAEYHDVLQQEAELTAGHGVLRYTGLIVVSAPAPDELEAAVAAVQQVATQASCETRRVHGQQTSAFHAAGLPFGCGV